MRTSTLVTESEASNNGDQEQSIERKGKPEKAAPHRDWWRN